MEVKHPDEKCKSLISHYRHHYPYYNWPLFYGTK